MCIFFFFKQKTAYEMRISDWSSDVCSSDLLPADRQPPCGIVRAFVTGQPVMVARPAGLENQAPDATGRGRHQHGIAATLCDFAAKTRSEEHTSDLQSLMRHSFAGFRLKKKKTFTQFCITHNTSYP